VTAPASRPTPAARPWSERQHRDAVLLMANTGLAAAAGLAFWLVLTRALALPPEAVGLGYATVAVGTMVGVLAKGGLDAALLRALPSADGASARRLLALATLVGGATALLTAAALAFAGQGGSLGSLGAWTWAATGAIGVLLVVTWLQDTWFLAEGKVRVNLWRTLAASAVRIALPFALVAWGLSGPGPVAVAWAAALLASAALGWSLSGRRAARAGRPVGANEFLASSARNFSGSAAEFLPGLLLSPLVLAVAGAASAAHFGMAWTMASLLFLAAGAIGRSALAAMARPSAQMPRALRRGLLQILAIVGPGAVLAALLAPWLLGVFGAGYAAEGTAAFRLLCASVVVVAPASLYLAVLRLRERTLPLVALPLSSVAFLLALAPALESRMGLEGVALAWILANVPFGAWAAVRLAAEARARPGPDPSSPRGPSLEVNRATQPVGGHPHLE
jgi:O-antigen/teichoic acid export membrane protein